MPCPCAIPSGPSAPLDFFSCAVCGEGHYAVMESHKRCVCKTCAIPKVETPSEPKCPNCNGPDIDAAVWTEGDGSVGGEAWCTADGCGWSSLPSHTHRTHAERKADEAVAKQAWHAEVATHPDLLPY